MAHCVYTAVNAVQPPPSHSPVDGVIAQPQRQELGPSDHPVLPPRQVRNRAITGVLRNLTVHYAAK